MKKLLSIALAIIMLLSVFTVIPTAGACTAFSDNDEDIVAITSGDYRYIIQSDKTASITGYSGEKTEINIPDNIDGHKVTSISYRAFYACTKLTNVTIPDGVTSIGENAFYSCLNLTNITIPDSVTTVGEKAFGNTQWFNNQPNGLIYIGDILYGYKGTCPSDVTIKEGTRYIADSAFMYCLDLTNITIPDGVTKIGDKAFYRCENLKNIVLPNTITHIGNKAFYLCKSMTSIAIPNSLSKINENVFDSCTGLKNITLPNSITLIDDEAFARCKNLESITIPVSVSHICGCAFLGCGKLKDVYYAGSKSQWSAIDDYCISCLSSDCSLSECYLMIHLANTAIHYNGSTAQTTVKLKKSSASIFRTGKVTIKATVNDGCINTTYKSNKTSVARVNANGVVTGISKGTAKITVTNNGAKKTFTVTVKNPKLNRTSIKLKKNRSFPLEITGKVGKATFKSSKTKVATVNKNGKITAKKKGNAIITVTTNGMKLKCNVTVK